MDSLNETAVKNFCEYLRCSTVQPNPDYSKAVEFLKGQSEQLQLDFQVIELVPSNPIVIMKWKGRNPNLQSVVLNSHMDVVPVFPEHWTYPPFSAHIDESGKIFARGSQDMKCVGSQYLEAVRRIRTKSPQYVPERDIYILFVPDEEVGGVKGMMPFVESDTFRKMNIGIVMDEGLASPEDKYSAFYGDRIVWWIRVYIRGATGHGSQFIQNSAGEKVRFLINKFLDFRDQEEKRMVENSLTLGDVTTVNLTGMTGGVQHNVVPSPFTLDFDVRITPSTNLEEFEKMLEGWAAQAGDGITFEFHQKVPEPFLTSTDSSNPWWVAFESVCKSMQMEIVPQVFPAGTDSRFIREKKIAAIGFSPMNKTPILLHDHNEFLHKDTFIRGVGFYEQLIPALAEVADH